MNTSKLLVSILMLVYVMLSGCAPAVPATKAPTSLPPTAVADPDIRPIYVQMAVDHNKNPGRPFDMAVSDYYHHGNDLLWKKHMGDQEKPKNWNMAFYAWYFTKPKR